MTPRTAQTAQELDTEKFGCDKRENSASKDTNPKDAIGANKVPLHLLSPVAKAYWALAQFAGMVKYGAWNWRVAGVRSSVYLAAMARHMDAYLSGEDYDPVDGVHHLGAVMACAAIIIDAQEAGKLTDDRPPSVAVKNAYSDAENRMMALRNMYADRAPTHYTKAPATATAPAPDPVRESASPGRKVSIWGPNYDSFYWGYTP